MLSRERVWMRVAGAPWWGLSWGLALVCSLPWWVPESWNGVMPVWLLWAGGMAMVFLCLLLLYRRRWIGVALSLLVLPGLAALRFGYMVRWEQSLPRGLQAFQGTLSAPWALQGDHRMGALRVEAPAELRGLNIPLSLPAEGAPPPAPGTPVRVRAELRAVEPGPTFLGERPRWRALEQGTSRRVFLRSAWMMEVLGPPQPGFLLRLQTFLRTRFEALPLPVGPARDLWGAMALGIPPARDEAFSAFAESGTIHTLVVSGLQVTLIVAVVEALWRRCFRKGATLACMIMGLLYAAAVGFNAPVWRGLCMGLAWALGRRTGWKVPPVLALHGALWVWLLVHPTAGAAPGFLLAWFALLGLLWGAEPLAGLWAPLLGRWSLPLARFWAPWFSTLPLLALFHGGAPLWGVLANVVVLPLVGLLTPLCLGLLFLPVPGLTQALAWVLFWMSERLVPFFAGIQPLATGLLWPWFALIGGWILLAHAQARLWRTRALVGMLAATSILLVGVRGVGRSAETLVVEAPDIGQGDALLLRVPGGAATLIDTGPSPWAARRLARVLSRRGVREPVDLVVTHPHGDHAGGWATLARIWPIRHTRLPGVEHGESRWRLYAPTEGLWACQTLLRGQGWNTGEALFSTRWPPKALDVSDLNMISMVLRVRWRDRELWLMGDALTLQERDLMDLGDPEPFAGSRLLKPGHHGGAGASSQEWIEALKPQVVLFTAGRDNRFGFPTRETLDRVQAVGNPEIAVSGVQGGVQIRALKERWEVQTGKRGAWEAP